MARIVYFAKLREQSAHRRRYLGQLQCRFSCDAESAFRTDKRSQQVISRRAAEIDDVATCKHNATTKHVVRSGAIFQTVNAARTFGDVPSDRAAWLTRGIRNVIQAKRRNCSRYVQVHDARLDHGETVLDVDTKNLAHARQLDHYAGVERECAA